MTHSTTKKNGIHYTPPALAEFLAEPIVRKIKRSRKRFSVLDPACGDGALLRAVLAPLSSAARKRVQVVGFEQSSSAAKSARRQITDLATQVDIRTGDFLQSNTDERFDAVISNPPYVRTQVLGAKQAQRLAQQFGLTGRVDLYQAFVLAMSHRLCDGGLLALLTSNRFLTVKSGKALRSFLRSRFRIQSVVDLGDTRLFSAAVLPVVVTAIRTAKPDHHPTDFTRIYSTNGRTKKTTAKNNSSNVDTSQSILAAVRNPKSKKPTITTSAGEYQLERGTLAYQSSDEVWTLMNTRRRDWLKKVTRNQQFTFGDLAEIRVGIKTTADAVFIRSDWDSLDKSIRPERRLLRPLVTHHDAKRWKITGTKKKVLYPHRTLRGRRATVDLSKHPAAESYLREHYPRLAGREYLIQGGREWFEIWVPHNPSDWAAPKLVWPDISETPKFFLDASGAIVNGDCYWIRLKPEIDDDWLLMMLAVGNSTVATEFYDSMFHNKLYAGRRRFMTQYVKQFPLPARESQAGKKIVDLVRQVIQHKRPQEAELRERLEIQIDQQVRKAFGLSRIPTTAQL
jgi:tRNA1(Val) A37 N6-methylase TrmN6